MDTKVGMSFLKSSSIFCVVQTAISRAIAVLLTAVHPSVFDSEVFTQAACIYPLAI
jgi:hypothetical protein